MQTFLPFDDFTASARVLDSARLGKQRLEAVQALRALTFPVYGWRNHPAARMWRGFRPALTAYTLATIDEWTARGNTDALRPLVLEFAPEVERMPQDALAVPTWLGTAAFHDSHRSNLVRKVPEYYREFFPDVADDLPYLWPPAEAPEGADEITDAGPRVTALRPRTADERAEWAATGVVAIADTAVSGRRPPAWAAQSEEFARLRPGDDVAVGRVEDATYTVASVTSSPMPYASDGVTGLRLGIDIHAEVERASFPHPVLMQDPRSVFSTLAPR